ncbi:Coenzyme F420 hydrogenase/dehydrogenase, beta subunit C-terminal domain [Roseibium sp.]|uniref:Coenzyme F420 hydrogenase/dehydrogenase, beta subunit C-terminal domain n=1 Tax=Roseibium sp. TaxID=1936156 RepID=UPI003D12226C
MTRTAKSISEVVTSGLCIGCGLCEAITERRVQMTMTPLGGLRPDSVDTFTSEEEDRLLSCCPGVVARARPQTDVAQDMIWGHHSTMRYAWAGAPEVRFKSATGGVLSALGMHLVESGTVDFVLHVAPDPDHPMRSTWVMSETAQDVLDHAGSRYGPTAPLAGFMTALERGQPFAIIAKPCDVGAVHALSRVDGRVDQLCVARLVMVCGGQSRLGKSRKLLDEFGLEEDELSLFRYRGHGNPGLTTVETKDGRKFEKTYQELWEDEGSWELETRCKLCPDALGEAADIAAADVWPGGGPIGEDDGFNGIIVRSPAGEALIESAESAGNLMFGGAITPREFDDFQPHQVRKKHAVHARLTGLSQAGFPMIDTQGLRLEELDAHLQTEARTTQISGIKERIASGRIGEPLPEKD